MKNCIKIIWMIMVLFSFAGYAGAYSPSNFTDVFTNPKLMSYCSQSASINGVAGQSGVCPGGLYYYTETVSGFKDMNNPNDPKRLCQNDGACSPDPQVMYLGGSYRSIHSADGKVPSLFRIYIPPGTTGISMSLYVPQVRVATVVRMGQPPVNPSKPVSEYQYIQTPGLLLNDVMNGGDFWVRNGDGCIITFSGGGWIDQNILLSKGFSDRWLYIQVVDYDGAWLETLSFALTIGDMAAYRAWYNSVNWDCYNNPGSATCSDIPTPTSYTVSFAASPAAGGTVNSTSQTVISGNSTSPVTATPNTNYAFLNWTGPNGVVTTSPTLPAQVVTAPVTYTANFTPSQTTQYTVNFVAGTGGFISGSASQTITSGGTTTAVTATPNSGYKFINWTGSNGSTFTSDSLTISNVRENVTYTANFQQITQYTVTFLAGINGTINGGSSASQTVTQGNSTTAVTATPNNNSYQFVNWTGSGGFTSTANPLTVSNVSSNMAVVANFQAIPTVTVTFSANTGGFVTGDSVQRVNQNSNAAAVTAIAESNYHFVNWTGTGGFTSSTNTLTVNNVTSDMVITANFSMDVDDSMEMNMACVEYLGVRYRFTLKYAPVAEDPSELYWKMDMDTVKSPNNPNCTPIAIGNNLNLNIPSMSFRGKAYKFTMNYNPIQRDPFGLYWKMDLSTVETLSY